MKEILISQGKIAIVDDLDYEAVSQYKWQWNGRYVVRRRRVAEGEGPGMVYLHRFIARAQEGEVVDHADCNTLNNVRANLRICLSGQNVCNRRVCKISKTGVKGVFPAWMGGTNKMPWRAKVKMNGKVYLDQRFWNIEDAKAAYDRVAKQVQGEFSRS